MIIRLYFFGIILFVLLNGCSDFYHLHLVRTEKKLITSNGKYLPDSLKIEHNSVSSIPFTEGNTKSSLGKSESIELSRTRKDDEQKIFPPKRPSKSKERFAIPGQEKSRRDQQGADKNKFSLVSTSLGIAAFGVMAITVPLLLFWSLAMIGPAAVLISALIGALFSSAAIITGVVGIIQTKSRNEKGWGFALAGIIIGALTLVWMLEVLKIVTTD